MYVIDTKRNIRFDSKRATVLLRGMMITRDMIVRDSPFVNIPNATFAYADRILRFTDLEVELDQWYKVRSGDSDELRRLFVIDVVGSKDTEIEGVVEEAEVTSEQPLPEITTDPVDEIKESEPEAPASESVTVSVDSESSEATTSSYSDGSYDKEYQDYIQENAYETKPGEPVEDNQEEETQEHEETVEDEEATSEEEDETVEEAENVEEPVDPNYKPPIPQHVHPSKKKKHR